MFKLSHSCLLEFIGTFFLVLVGCGSAVLSGPYVGYLGIALAFGLTLMTLTYLLGSASGCHVNPAVTVTLWLAGKFPKDKVLTYVVSQILGGILAGGVLYVVASGESGFSLAKGFASNGLGTASPNNYSVLAGMVTEATLTALLLLVALAAATGKIAKDISGLAIGGVFASMHLFAMPVTNASFNIARTLATAVFEGGTALSQSWMFILSHAVAIAIALYVFRLMKK